MKLKEYIKDLQKVAKQYPNLDVIYAIDDEGNEFRKVEFGPTLGDFDSHSHDFAQIENQEDEKVINAVCIN